MAILSESTSNNDGPSIAVIVLDTVRKDVFDEYFDWLPGRRYGNTWAPSHWTVPVHASLFGGKYPSEIGVHAKNQILNYPGDVLAEQLSKNEYRTRAFCSNPNISPAFGFDRGFDDFDGGWRLNAFDPDIFDWQEYTSETEHTGIKKYLSGLVACVKSDANTVDSLKYGVSLKMRHDKMGKKPDDGAASTLKYVKKTDFSQKEFFFANLMEAHAPYDPPEEYNTVDAAYPGDLRAVLSEPLSDPDDLRQAYRDSVRYLSDMYKGIFDELREDFDYIITISDHGELLGERGGWEHLSGVDPELTHVPMVVTGPGLEGETMKLSSLIDVHATIREISDLPESEGLRGKNLIDDQSWNDSRSVLTEYWGLTSGHEQALKEEGYDPEPLKERRHGIALSPDYYGYETREGWTEQGDKSSSSSPKCTLSNLLESRNILEYKEEEIEVSEEAKEQLKDLGYV